MVIRDQNGTLIQYKMMAREGVMDGHNRRVHGSPGGYKVAHRFGTRKGRF